MLQKMSGQILSITCAWLLEVDSITTLDPLDLVGAPWHLGAKLTFSVGHRYLPPLVTITLLSYCFLPPWQQM